MCASRAFLSPRRERIGDDGNITSRYATLHIADTSACVETSALTMLPKKRIERSWRAANVGGAMRRKFLRGVVDLACLIDKFRCAGGLRRIGYRVRMSSSAALSKLSQYWE